MNTNILTAILKMLAVIFPVLKYKGITADKPIVLLCENVGETADALTNLVRNFCEPGNYRKKLKELLGTGTDFLFCVNDGSFKASSMLGKIKQILETGEYNGKPINKLPIILSKSVLEEDVLPEAFYIDFTENEGDYVDIFDYAPKPEDISVVFEKIEQECAELLGTDLIVKAAACSFYPELKKVEKLELYDMTLNLVDEVIAKSKLIADAEGLDELFIDHLYTAGGNYELVPKEGITELSDGWKSKLYYSAEFLYVSESLMKELVKPLLKFTTYKALKAELAAKGIISTSSSNTFTSKMNVKNADGSYQRVTMLKFSREELTIPGELDIVSYLEGGVFSMILGKYKDKFIAFDMDKAKNKHLLLTGASGRGKTTLGISASCQLAANGKTVVLLDYHGIFADNQIHPALKKDFNAHLNEIDVFRDGIALPLFTLAQFDDGSYELPIDLIDSIANPIAEFMRFGDVQKSILADAMEVVYDDNLYEEEGFAAVGRVLENCGDDKAKGIAKRISQLTKHNVFRSGEGFIKEGMINVIRLSKFSQNTQKVISEILLAFIFRYAMLQKFNDKGLYLFVDEFHTLSGNEKAILNSILREGRKYNVNLILSSQVLGDKKTMNELVLQSGLTLFFEPPMNQSAKVAELVVGNKSPKWAFRLGELKTGECVAKGALCTEDGKEVLGPIVIDASLPDVDCGNNEARGIRALMVGIKDH